MYRKLEDIPGVLREWSDKRTLSHINLVNKYAKKLSREYKLHDWDKLHGKNHFAYTLVNLSHNPKAGFVPDENEKQIMDKAIYEHVTTNSHHIDYWDGTILKAGKKVKGHIKDGTKMPLEDILEMCCDWCAMSEENNNNVFEWFNSKLGQAFIFSKKQTALIEQTLHFLSPEQSKENLK